jgi:hypothetical protein
MNVKLTANSAFASAAIIAVLGIVARRLGLPWVSEVLAIFKLPGVEIGWDGIWLIVLITCIVFLIAVNAQDLIRWNKRRIEANKRYWNMNLCDTITYLSYSSIFGKAWPEKHKANMATGVLYEAAHKGTIDIAGQKKDSLLLTKISPNWFTGGTIINLKHCTRDEEKNAFLMESDNAKVIYSSLTVDRDQIERVWPRAPRSW